VLRLKATCVWAVLLLSGCTIRIVDGHQASSESVVARASQEGCPDNVCPWMRPDLPPELRESNYAGGSCVHAAFVACLRMQGREDDADRWRRTFAGGENASRLIARAHAAGLRVAYTRDGDAEFLEWCHRTRRPCVIFYKPSHAIVFVGYQDGRAVLMDNNHPGRLEYVERERFIRAWRGYGGFALTPVYAPTPPTPQI